MSTGWSALALLALTVLGILWTKAAALVRSVYGDVRAAIREIRRLRRELAEDTARADEGERVRRPRVR